MYSPVKPKVEKLSESKSAKRAQLAVLLVNKFRNKFKVQTTSESEIDSLIVSEVHKLLNSGSAK